MKKFHFGVINLRKYWSKVLIFVAIVVVGIIAAVGGIAQSASNTVSGVYYNGDRNSKNVSLMINVYWGTEYIQPMLDVLQEKGVKTTFFVGGTWAALNAETLRQIHQSGNEIANHGYHHKDFDKISAQEGLNEISNTHNIVKQLVGVDMNLFAPPSGAYNKTTVESANSLGYRTVMWTRDTIDWRDKDSQLIYSRATKNAGGGDLILMHPTACTLEALPKIIDYFQQNGFTCTTVSQTLGAFGD